MEGQDGLRVMELQETGRFYGEPGQRGRKGARRISTPS